jgi:broad specificity phosphatase PhoE
MKIYLIRHGESVDDIEDCYGGVADFPLTEAGRQTAKVLAQKLVESKIEILYSSPFKRASETAAIITEYLNCEIKIISDLKERNSYGVISGVNRTKAKQIFDHVFSQLHGKPGDYYADERILGDEPVTMFDTRVRSVFDQILKDAAGKKIIGIVTHGNVTRSIYRNILGVVGKVELDLLALTIINYSSGKLAIEKSDGVAVK